MAGSMAAAGAGPCTMTGMNGGMMSHAMPHCSAKAGPVVWLMASTKTYYLKGSARYGRGAGTYVCRATAVARGARPGTGMTGSHGTMGGSHGTMGGSQAMPPVRTMAPRPMPSPGSAMPGSMPMPPATPGPGLPNSTNAAPGSIGSPLPASSGNPASGNQGNTGAPGAGGQVPNNPASSSNSRPNPSPSPHS